MLHVFQLSVLCLSQDVHVDSLFRHLHESDGTPASERETSNSLKVSFTITDFEQYTPARNIDHFVTTQNMSKNKSEG
jgi:hypothetical protein